MIKKSSQSDSSPTSVVNWKGAKVLMYGEPSVLANW